VAIAADINADGVYDLVTADRTDNAVSIAIANTTVMTSNPELTIASQEDAEDMLEIFDNALSYINSARANIGALQSRLDFAESVNRTTVENISDARSRVVDTDFSQETAEFTKLLVLQQGGISVLGHANLNAKLALKLLDNI
jgi:flagellin